MDNSSASSPESGFDAALKALEDLETSVAQTQDVPVVKAASAAPVAISAEDLGDAALKALEDLDLGVSAAPAASAAAIAVDDDALGDAALKALEDLENIVLPSAPAAMSDADLGDAALRALEDLESLTQQGSGGPSIAFSDVALGGDNVAITAVPFADMEQLLPSVSASDTLALAAAAAMEATTPPKPAAAPASRLSRIRLPRADGLFGKIAIGAGLISSVVSAAGLVVAERTIKSAELVVADARERQHQLERANKLIEDLEIIRARQVQLLRAQQAQAISDPVTSAELHHQMEVLQNRLVERDPLNDVVQAIQVGNVASNARLTEFGRKIERVEAALQGN